MCPCAPVCHVHFSLPPKNNLRPCLCSPVPPHLSPLPKESAAARRKAKAEEEEEAEAAAFAEEEEEDGDVLAVEQEVELSLGRAPTPMSMELPDDFEAETATGATARPLGGTAGMGTLNDLLMERALRCVCMLLVYACIHTSFVRPPLTSHLHSLNQTHETTPLRAQVLRALRRGAGGARELLPRGRDAQAR